MPTDFDQAFDRVKQLTADFQANAKFYLSPGYQEAEARRDFIDKFLIALGWDVNHDTQKNPYEQEVKVERREQGVSQRRADYAFYAAPNFGDVKFIMEAKKPRGDIATPDNYLQVILYGWNSRTPIAALFDFAQFEIVDCRFKPDVGTALQRNLKKFTLSQYTDQEKFAEIYWLFSREAVAAGSLDKYAETLPKKRGSGRRGFPKGGDQRVDDAFLEALDAHRDALAHNFKNHNPALDGETLAEVTQRTLDRLVFIRFLEDKLIEPQNLISKFGERGSAWDDFTAASRRLDGIYNGIIFKKHQRLDSPDFKVDASQFADICKRLSHVGSIYNFNSIPIHILGSIYERFLGKVVVATGKRTRVEEKPEVRKAGGVFYTPEYIARYIVENTVGKLIEGKTPPQIAEMRFADIACGSGSFLLAMFDLLIRHHTKYYNDNPGKAKKGDTVERDDGLHLSLQKKREVLLNNIYGVDIDAQAVEVAQLSLYLKLLQDETPGSTRQFLLDFEQQALLPSLNKNIVCGNSLIGRDIVVADFFENGDSERKLNPMNFEDAFPRTMKAGGFDAIVGNPPYIFTRNEGLSTNEKLYFYKNYHHQSAQLNTFGLFLEKSQGICRKGAALGYITPNNWLTIDSFAPLRRFLLKETSDLTVINILDRVFAAAHVDTAIVLLVKGDPTKVTLAEMRDTKISFSGVAPIRTFKPEKYIMQIALVKDKRARNLMARIESVSVPLGEACTVSTGLKVYQTGKGKPPQSDREKGGRVFHASKKLNRTYGPYLDGVDVCRYYLSWSGEWLRYGDWLAEPRRSVPFSGERILVRQIPSSPPYLVHGVFTDQPFYNDINSMVIFGPKDRISLMYLLALVNSRLISSWFQKTYDKLQRRIFPQFKVNELAAFPIRRIAFDKPADKGRHDKMVLLVEQMLSAKKQLAGAQSDKDKDFYEKKCAALDRQIDALVYELYGVTAEELKIVEGEFA